MDITSFLLPTLLILGLFATLFVVKRRLFSEQKTHPPIPFPGTVSASTFKARDQNPMPLDGLPTRDHATQQAPKSALNLSPARLYPRKPLSREQLRTYSNLLKSLTGYVVLPSINYSQFLRAKDGSPSENTSLDKRVETHVADFVVCDPALNVLLVCQLVGGDEIPARIDERERLLKQVGLRLLRWNPESPPEGEATLKLVKTLHKLQTRSARISRRGKTD